MTSEQKRPDYRAVFQVAGSYAVAWHKDGKRKTVERWVNSADELVDLLDGWIVRGYDIVAVRYVGQ